MQTVTNNNNNRIYFFTLKLTTFRSNKPNVDQNLDGYKIFVNVKNQIIIKLQSLIENHLTIKLLLIKIAVESYLKYVSFLWSVFSMMNIFKVTLYLYTFLENIKILI